jgi:hypothetical protein
MKTKSFLLVLALLFAANFGFASFPVQKQVTTEVVSPASKIDAKVTDVQASAQVEAQDMEELSSPAAGGGKSQLIALLLVIFVGTLGIHRFYLGYTWQGVVQLLTLGGCGIWSLIDLIRIITGDLKPKNGEYTDKL